MSLQQRTTWTLHTITQRTQRTKAGTILSLLYLTAILVVAASFCLQYPYIEEHAENRLEKRVGNEYVAADIYGLGVRVGIYLQSFSLLFTLARPKRDPEGSTSLLVTAAFGIAVLTSWLKLAHQRQISAAESAVVLSMAAVIMLPSYFVSTVDSRGNGLGIMQIHLFLLFYLFATIWFWSTGYKNLPELGTRKVTWFFAEVRIDHWFRIYLTFVTVVGLVGCVAGIYFSYGTLLNSFYYWKDATQDGEDDDDKSSNAQLASTFARLSVLILWFPIACVEMTIRLNGLQPQNNLALPGQLIPFVVGLATMLDALSQLLRPRSG